MSLQGKRALVTGAGSGIGRASAVRFAAAGARVLALDVDAAGVGETVEGIRRAGGEAVARVGDAADDATVRDAVELCCQELGGLEVAFANAGIGGGLPTLADLTPEAFHAVLRVNLIGPFLAIKHASAAMARRSGGSILCTASVAGLRAGAGGIPYSASKAALINLVQTSAFALAEVGVRVNAICPGLVETGMTWPIFEGARRRGREGRLGGLTALRRPGRPEEVAELALFLASEASSYVTGQAYAVDGGLSASHPLHLSPR